MPQRLLLPRRDEVRRLVGTWALAAGLAVLVAYSCTGS